MLLVIEIRKYIIQTQINILDICFQFVGTIVIRTSILGGDANMSTNKQANRLIYEKCPYLLQHAHNPVNWFPWSDEAFQKAKSEDKPIFLSIGYS